MRLYRLRSEAGDAHVAIAVDDGAPVDVAEAFALAGGGSPPPYLRSMLELIQTPAALHELVEVARTGSSGHAGRAGAPSARWLPPLESVSSLRDFLAFEDHVKRGARRRGSDVPDHWYEAPVYYKGNHRAILGPDDECPWPAYTNRLDFELELALVVGTGGRNIAARDAARHIFGFTIFNDFSARDVQAREMSAWLGPAKGKDFANALGPCIVTIDEVGPEPDLAMSCRINGEEWGRARSSEMYWRWADMIAHVSQAEDIWPGDVYGSGTPGGCCGLDLDRALRPGDVVELEIERIGVLRNTIGAPPASRPEEPSRAGP
ncbi:MAG: fumarylacetoacetate hydrolase family protein [Actinomycetota bacterium]